MKVIVGLGNPGDKYRHTRHNLGFIIIDELISKINIYSKLEKYSSHIYEHISKDGEKILICKPQTYMNNSGEALSQIKNSYKLSEKDFLVIYDDLDIAEGKFKYSINKSSGGHNGIKNIIKCLGSFDFLRLRAGIGPREKAISIVDYVLEEFSITEISKIKLSFPSIIESIKEFIDGAEIQKLQNTYNRLYSSEN